MTAQAQTETLHTQLTDIIQQKHNYLLPGIPPADVANRIIAKLQELNPKERCVYEHKMTEDERLEMQNVRIFERYLDNEGIKGLAPYAPKTFYGGHTAISVIFPGILVIIGLGLTKLYPTVNPQSDLDLIGAIILTCIIALPAIALVGILKQCAEECLNNYVERSSGAVLEQYVARMADKMTQIRSKEVITNGMNMRNC